MSLKLSYLKNNNFINKKEEFFRLLSPDSEIDNFFSTFLKMAEILERKSIFIVQGVPRNMTVKRKSLNIGLDLRNIMRHSFFNLL